MQKNNSLMQQLMIKLDRHIETVNVLRHTDGSFDTLKKTEHNIEQDLTKNNAHSAQLLSILKTIKETLSRFQEATFAKYSQDIARLSVEIARKVLEQKIKDNDYEIESIINQALDGLTIKQNIVVRLNPKDHKQIEELLKNSEIPDFHGLAFVADERISPAECILETPQGKIESLIEEKLHRITEALTKTE